MRRMMRERKSNVPMQEKEILSARIFAKVEQLSVFEHATTILCYYSLPDEVQTVAFLGRWHAVKELVLPEVLGDELILRRFRPDSLRVGYKNIVEPHDTAIVDPADIDLAIVPGMAFDDNRNRLGRGKGFYDRLLPQLHCTTIGVGFNFQIVPNVPTEPLDKQLDLVITD